MPSTIEALVEATYRSNYGRTYFESRGLTAATIDSWKLGYWHEPYLMDIMRALLIHEEEVRREGYTLSFNGRVTVPLLDSFGKPVGLCARTVYNDRVRWLYPANKTFSKGGHLLGLSNITIRNLSDYPPIMVEGPFDAILGQQNGFPTVCVHGSSFTVEQALLMRALNRQACIIVPDGDEEGNHMLRKIAKLRNFLPSEVYIAFLPHGSDPASLMIEDLDGFKAAIDKAVRSSALSLA